MVQPFVPAFYSMGERSLIFIDGRFTHAMRQRFSLRHGLDQEGLMPVEVEEEELAFAERVLHLLPMPALFARVDLVRDHRQQLLLHHVEVIDPALYLAHSQQALRRLTDACIQRLQQAGERRQPTGSLVQEEAITSSCISSAIPLLLDKSGKQEAKALVMENCL